MPMNVKLEVFEGPLDLLLHLIEKNELDIYDIPIAIVTVQYIEYLNKMKELDLEIASEFLLMAATLLEIKSKMLLPKPKKQVDGAPEIDPREELIQKLIEYKKYKEITGLLKDKLTIHEKVFYKHPEPIEDYIKDFDSLTGIDIDFLVKSYNSLILKAKSSKKSSFREIYREVVTVDDKMLEITTLISSKKLFSFEDLFDEDTTRYEIIVTFLAILELIKRKTISIMQECNFGRIVVKRRNV